MPEGCPVFEPRRRKPLPPGPELFEASCVNTDEDWTPDTQPDLATLRRLRAICEGCPVIASCATTALSIQATGFWAGQWVGVGEKPRTAGREALRARFG